MKTPTMQLRVATNRDREGITNFFWKIGDELGLPGREAAETVTDLVYTNGGAIVGHHDGVLMAALGYFLGEPEQNYANKEVGFIYVTAIAKPYRHSFACWQGLAFTIRHLKNLGIQEVRCHAAEHDPYTNRIYSHFAKPLGKATSLRGDPTILYGNKIDNVLAYIESVEMRATGQTSSARVSKV